MDTTGKIGIIGIVTQVFKRQYSDGFAITVGNDRARLHLNDRFNLRVSRGISIRYLFTRFHIIYLNS